MGGPQLLQIEKTGPGSAASSPARGSFVGTTGAGLIGFVVGIVFWHTVGFWGFVNEAVFHRHGESASAAPPPRPVAFPVKAQSRHAGIPEPMQAAADACTEAVAQADAAALLEPCQPLAFKFQPSRGIEPADFADFGPTPVPTLINAADTPFPGAPAVSGWSAQIEPSDKPRAP